MKKYLITACIAALAAGPALADCPTSREDVRDGIYVHFDGYAMRFQLRQDGSMEEVETYFDGSSTLRFITYGGVFVTDSWEMEGGRIIAETHHETRFSVPMDQVPDLTVGMVWTGSAETDFADGTSSQEAITVSAGQPTVLTLGACSYDALHISIQHLEPGAAEPHVDQQLYLPDLGIAIYLSGGVPSERVMLETPLAISFEPPMIDADGSAPQDVGQVPGNPSPDASPSK